MNYFIAGMFYVMVAMVVGAIGYSIGINYKSKSIQRICGYCSVAVTILGWIGLTWVLLFITNGFTNDVLRRTQAREQKQMILSCMQNKGYKFHGWARWEKPNGTIFVINKNSELGECEYK